MATGQDNFGRKIAAARASLVAGLWMLRSIVRKMYDGVKGVVSRPKAAAAAAVLVAVPAQGAMITQADPYHDDSLDKWVLPAEVTNDDNQAVYDSFTLSSLKNAQDWQGNSYDTLAHALYQLVPENQTAYSSAEEMMADWIVALKDEPVGEISRGWSADFDASDIKLTHIDGIPGVSYEQWLATQQDAQQDMAAPPVFIPEEHFGDLSLRLTEESYPGVGVGSQTGGFPDKVADGKRYVVVPEPSALALIGLGGLGVGLRRRRDSAYKG